jgi:NADH:ubiquinone oxidoreductase subunit 6 (subunit J)
MSRLDIFAIIILIVLLVAILVAWVALAMLPGKIARARNHHQAEAINVGGWISALLIGPWPIMLVWAFMRPIAPTAVTEENQQLRQKLSELEHRLVQSKGSAS